MMAQPNKSEVPCVKISIDCKNRVQAGCFECRELFCFNCSLVHAKANNSHNLHDMDACMNKISEKSEKLITKLKQCQVEINKKVEEDAGKSHKESENDINPEKFQEQLNYISMMEKQTIKIVEKFYSELSLELVNIWEAYLKRYSTSKDSVNVVEKLIQKVQKFNDQSFLQTLSKSQAISEYWSCRFEEQTLQIAKSLEKGEEGIQQSLIICPDVQINEKVLISISQLLCAQISTKNYQIKRFQSKPQDIIDIMMPDTVDQAVKILPIFPICKKHCYLYNFEENCFEIQEFDSLDFLPAFPRSVMLHNGDIHLIGGANSNQEILKTHIVYRSMSSELFKLANIPVARNPINGLLYKDKNIYLIGGLNERKQWDLRCFIYSLRKKQWAELASMKHTKPHQSSAIFQDKIYCFGIPFLNNVNIEEYSIEHNQWKTVNVSNFLCNPFNFSAGFSTIQINESQILFFGGKKYVQNLKTQKKSTDREVSSLMYLFQPDTDSFIQLGALNPCIGVRDGEINPLIKNGKIYAPEYILSRDQPIARWLSAMNILEISSTKAESVMILNDS